MLSAIDPPLFAAALLGLFAGVSFERLRADMRRSAWRARKARRGEVLPFGRREPGRRPPDPTDPADQLRIVSEAEFAPKRLMNGGEWKVFAAAERACGDLAHGWRVHPQVSLGEVLSSPDPVAHRCVNSKRVDMLVVCPKGRPLAAIEYQGDGHHLGTTAPARDAVKREALRRAGVRFVEMTPEHGPEDIRRELGRIATVDGLRPQHGEVRRKAAKI